MKLILIYAASMIVLISCGTLRQSAEKEVMTFADNPVVAHRGAWKLNDLPENSLASLRQAIKLGCTGSEFDVRITADDSLIINHDPAYNKLDVEKTDFNTLRAIPLKNGEKLPTLREYIREGLKNNTTTRLVCEIKPSTTSKQRGEDVAARVYKLVQELNAYKMVVYISFDAGILNKLRSLDKNVHTQYLNGGRSPDTLKAQSISGADYQMNAFKKNPEWINSAKENKITLNAWTVDKADDMEWLLANKFDYITTNEPELLFSKLKETPAANGWTLAWSDEFNSNGLPDMAKWNYTEGGGGYGNHELQYYTKNERANAVIKDGKLLITAIKETKDTNGYTSARLNSFGKAEWKYGRMEIRAKLPAGRGTWPAIWMLGTDRKNVGWPACGEIDIIEHVGFDPEVIHGTIHTTAYNHMKGTQKGKNIKIAGATTDFHTYSVEWTAEDIKFFVDDQLYNHIKNEHLTEKEWPFDKPFYMILNVAVGGDWGGQKGVDDTVFPATMEIDYVRVYK